MTNIVFKQSGTTRMTTSKSYDYLNRLQQISSAPGASGVSPVTFNYAYNDAGQRTKRTETDASFWVYQYDSLGQVISGKKYWNDGTPVPGQQFEYGFDDIGNRTSTKAGGDSVGSALRSASYSANTLNQYTSRDVPNAFDVLGASHATNSVTVNASPADYRRGEYFQELVSVVNSSTSVWQRVAVTNTGGSWSTGNVFVAKTQEAFTYDADGNLTSDGRWTYAWDLTHEIIDLSRQWCFTVHGSFGGIFRDVVTISRVGENRLINMTSGSSTPTGSKFKMDFAYDWKGRRIEKQVSTNNGSYFGQYTNRYVYDGWNLVAELNSTNGLIRGYVWGLDLSGSEQGAGGVGGLLALNDATNGLHFCGYDGNGNLAVLTKATDGTVSANYEYGPFGEVLRSSGTMARANPFRFSSKYQDDESDQLYYGYRFYNSSTGRWLSRDPIGETGGINLYEAIHNSLIGSVDVLGLFERKGRNITVGKCEVVIVFGHGSYKKPFKFKFEDGCNSAVVVTCFPDKQIESVPEDKQFKSQSKSSGRCMWNCPKTGILRDEADKADMDSESGKTWDADKNLEKVFKELSQKLKDLCKCGCEEINVIFVRSASDGDKDVPVYQNFTYKCK